MDLLRPSSSLLDRYSRQIVPDDEAGAFLAWIVNQRAAAPEP